MNKYLIKINNKRLEIIRASKYNIIESEEGYRIYFIDKNSPLISNISCNIIKLLILLKNP